MKTKVYLFALFTAASVFISGCINSFRFNESQDEIWIRKQLKGGETLPDILKRLSFTRIRGRAEYLKIYSGIANILISGPGCLSCRENYRLPHSAASSGRNAQNFRS